jgi:hypothetical protein
MAAPGCSLGSKGEAQVLGISPVDCLSPAWAAPVQHRPNRLRILTPERDEDRFGRLRASPEAIAKVRNIGVEAAAEARRSPRICPEELALGERSG